MSAAVSVGLIPVGPFHNAIEFHEENYPYWRDHFPPDSRRQMIEDDVLAGESVCGVLIGVLTTGLVLGIVTLCLILASS